MTAKFTPSAAMVCTLELGGSVPVVAGQLYTYTTYAIVDNYPVADPNRSVTFRPFVSWRDSTGAEVEPPRKEVWGSTSAADPGFPYVVYDLQTTAPPGATSAVLLAEIDHTSTTATAYYLDRTSFVESEPNYVLTSHPDEGFISLDIPLTPPTEEDLLTVWRVSPDGSRTPIRSYAGDVDRIPYVMGEYLSFEDYEAPAGEEVWYWIEWRNSSDIVSRYYISTRTITAPAPADPTYVWVKSPGLPALNTSAQVVAPVAWSRAARESRYDIVGRSSPVVRTDTRASRVGTLQLYAWTTADYEALSDLLTAGLPVLIQAHQGRGMDGNLYAAVGDATSDPIEGPPDDPSWIWSLKLTEIDRPSGALQGSAGRTWDDVEDLDAWADLMDTYDSWQAVLTG